MEDEANKPIFAPLILTNKFTPVVFPISFVDVSAYSTDVPCHTENTVPALAFEPLVKI